MKEQQKSGRVGKSGAKSNGRVGADGRVDGKGLEGKLMKILDKIIKK
jgi:hypothetical protein